MARIFVYDDREFPDPRPRDDRRAGEGNPRRLLRRDRQRLGQGDDQGPRTPSTSSSAGWVPRGPSLAHGARKGGHMDTRTFAGLLAATPPNGPAHHRAHGGAHTGPTAPSTWTPRPHDSRRWRRPAPRRRSTPRPPDGSWRQCGASCAPAAPERASGAAPAASAVAAGAGHHSRLRRRLRMVQRAGAPPLPRRGGGGALGPPTCARGWSGSPGSSPSATSPSTAPSSSTTSKSGTSRPGVGCGGGSPSS